MKNVFAYRLTPEQSLELYRTISFDALVLDDAGGLPDLDSSDIVWLDQCEKSDIKYFHGRVITYRIRAIGLTDLLEGIDWLESYNEQRWVLLAGYRSPTNFAKAVQDENDGGGLWSVLPNLPEVAAATDVFLFPSAFETDVRGDDLLVISEVAMKALSQIRFDRFRLQGWSPIWTRRPGGWPHQATSYFFDQTSSEKGPTLVLPS